MLSFLHKTGFDLLSPHPQEATCKRGEVSGAVREEGGDLLRVIWAPLGIFSLLIMSKCITAFFLPKPSPTWPWARHSFSSQRDAGIEAQSRNWSFPSPPGYESGKIGIRTQDLTAPKPLQSCNPRTPWGLHLRKNTHGHLAQCCWALTTPRTLPVTSLLAAKKYIAVWLGQRKPQAKMSNKPGVICFYSFPCDCRRLSWFLLAQRSPFQEIILWNLLGN